MDFEARELVNMNYIAFEFEYHSKMPLNKVLKKVAKYLETEEVSRWGAYIESMSTHVHPDEERWMILTVVLGG